MLAFSRAGSGPPLVLLHGTNSSRAIWNPLLARLAVERDVIAFDLPGHGASPATSLTPPGFAAELAVSLDQLSLRAPAVVGHSVGGWTALELAKLGRAGSVLALAPAGLWRKHSPWLTDLGLRVNWRLGQLLDPSVTERVLRTRHGRQLALRSISARPGNVPCDVAIATARAARSSQHFPEHFRRTRVLRFAGGRELPADLPIHVVWGANDHVALPNKSRFADELPARARIETWLDCGHMIMWDRPDDTLDAAVALPSGTPHT